jgi:hypothetical protein
MRITLLDTVPDPYRIYSSKPRSNTANPTIVHLPNTELTIIPPSILNTTITNIPSQRNKEGPRFTSTLGQRTKNTETT